MSAKASDPCSERDRSSVSFLENFLATSKLVNLWVYVCMRVYGGGFKAKRLRRKEHVDIWIALAYAAFRDRPTARIGASRAELSRQNTLGSHGWAVPSQKSGLRTWGGYLVYRVPVLWVSSFRYMPSWEPQGTNGQNHHRNSQLHVQTHTELFFWSLSHDVQEVSARKRTRETHFERLLSHACILPLGRGGRHTRHRDKWWQKGWPRFV